VRILTLGCAPDGERSSSRSSPIIGGVDDLPEQYPGVVRIVAGVQ